MANQDSFIDEVTDEVRREKLFKLLRRYGWIGILAVVLIVGGAGWSEYRKARERAEARTLGDAILAALDRETAEARAARLSTLDADGDAAVLLALIAAAQVDDPAQAGAALARLDSIASDAGSAPVYRDLAALKSVMLKADALAHEERIQLLTALSAPGAPYRTLALELIAHAQVEMGRTEEALATLTELLSDAEVSQGLRQRVTQLIVALGGSLDAT